MSHDKKLFFRKEVYIHVGKRALTQLYVMSYSKVIGNSVYFLHKKTLTKLLGHFLARVYIRKWCQSRAVFPNSNGHKIVNIYPILTNDTILKIEYQDLSNNV